MKKLLLSISACTFLSYAGLTQAQLQCRELTCDCASLPNESWQQVCTNQESQLRKACIKNPVAEDNYCTLHGPNANNLPLTLTLSSPAPLPKDQAVKLSNKVAMYYWSMYKSFEEASTAITKEDAPTARLTIGTFEHNLDALFEVQQLIAHSLVSGDDKPKAEAAWRDYASDTLKLAQDMFGKADLVLNNYATITEQEKREKSRLLGLKMMNLAGKMYEQAGYASAQGERHKQAAQAWKQASKASTLSMAHTFSYADNGLTSDFYRRLTAARLHRASYYWAISEGTGAAAPTLSESQKFMDEQSDLNTLVQEERNHALSMPFTAR